MRRVAALGAVVGLALTSFPAGAEPPLPDPTFAHPALNQVVTRPCSADPNNPFEVEQYRDFEGWPADPNGIYTRYPGTCQRMKFKFGPIHVKPGQNDVLIEPVTIQKPAYDGYIVRFRPDLVRADGSIPNIEELHLHHGTWLSLTNSYFKDPFFASGEEKTIANFPRDYGFPIRGTDQWQLLYMVHNQRPQPDEVWITYDIDYIAADAGAELGLKPVYPVWLDVRPSFYPVFNAQRGFGHVNPATGKKECTWPKEECADFDPWGNPFTGQGQAGNGKGTDWTLPAKGATLGRVQNFQGGTLIGLGGHLHPGGLNDDIDLVRTSKSGTSSCNGAADTGTRKIFVSDAEYWNHTPGQRHIANGPPTSWDMSMTVTGNPIWGIHVRPCDRLRINATYDADIQSTYENMGIAVGFIAPAAADGTPVGQGLDPFADPPVDTSENCDSGGLQATTPTLCLKGRPTHGHMTEAEHYGGPGGNLNGAMSSNTDQVVMSGFAYAPGDIGTAHLTGIPTVTPGSKVKFVNADAAANIYHTATSCAYPCTGSTGIAFPLSNGSGSLGGQVDFDSGELGYQLCFAFPPTSTTQGGCLGPAKNTIEWDLTIGAEFQEGGVYTYFCRVHPQMRGVFAVEG